MSKGNDRLRFEALSREHRRACAKLGELDVFLTGLRHIAHDAEFSTDLERLEAIRSMFAGTIRVRAIPTLRPGELKLEFYRMDAPAEPVPGVVDDHPDAFPMTPDPDLRVGFNHGDPKDRE
jgi:hypothetical protein